MAREPRQHQESAQGQGTAGPADFERLFREELTALALPTDVGVASDGPEPYATFVPADLAGICLSGGGIRSATFNLGLLEGLCQLDLIKHFNYLSTVSGGGYIGGWWTAWRSRDPKPQTPFPERGPHGEEPPEIRHLREFSNFLVPRIGFLEIETWQFISSVLVAAVPAAIAAGAVIVLGVLSYLLCAWAVMAGHRIGTAFVTAVTFGVLMLYEGTTARNERVGHAKYPRLRYLGCVLLACVATAVTFDLLRGERLGLGSPILFESGAGRLCDAIRCAPADTRFLWLPLLAWGAALVAVSFVRLLAQRWGIQSTATVGRPLLDRVLARLMALAVIWAAGLLILNLSLFLGSQEMAAVVGASGVGGGIVVSYLLRNFVLSSPSGSRPAGMTQSALRVLTPQVLAYLALVLIAAGVGSLVVQRLQGGMPGWLAFAVCVGIVLASMFLFDPNEMGLHPFYRSRIARAYLGASNFLAPHNRQVTANANDDILLRDLSARPLHLVSVTANDLGGDVLATLCRGARSAALSRHGFAVGNRWWPWTDEWKTSLASALTASGAALNPNMGSYSMQLGGAVRFLLGALNVRLGYWLRTERAGGWATWFPGAMFFRELFGRTHASDDSHLFHLSDGGHFENLGLYELLRRHCRYILVADCSADPEHEFNDLGNALRRAREDFAVEVEIDLTPLEFGAGKVPRQHVAVGDVRYAGGDRGVILLVKPVLVGGEPDDILQYRMRNSAFPHEATGDQFYDEAQWESYRRLGQHAASTIFRFAQDDSRTWTADDVFGQARLEWYPAPPGLREGSIAISARYYDVERQMKEVDHLGFLSGTYPELPWEPGTSATAPDDARSLVKLVPVMNQMMQLLEDVYITCDLKRFWNHPLNVGWMNTFGRWFTTPIVRAWWPILSPMFNRGAMAFAQDRFGLPRTAALHPVVAPASGTGVASLLWTWMGRDAAPSTMPFAYLVQLENGSRVELAVAFVEVRGTAALWAAGDFFVPPTFWCAGIGRNFLAALLVYLKAQRGCTEAEVTLVEPAIKDESRRKEHADLMQMYRQAGFEAEEVPDRSVARIKMRRSL